MQNDFSLPPRQMPFRVSSCPRNSYVLSAPQRQQPVFLPNLTQRWRHHPFGSGEVRLQNAPHQHAPAAVTVAQVSWLAPNNNLSKVTTQATFSQCKNTSQDICRKLQGQKHKRDETWTERDATSSPESPGLPGAWRMHSSTHALLLLLPPEHSIRWGKKVEKRKQGEEKWLFWETQLAFCLGSSSSMCCSQGAALPGDSQASS